MQQNYPPIGMERDRDIKVVGPKHLKIESYIRGNTKQAIWLISPTKKLSLAVTPPNLDNPFPIDRFAISPNEDFIFGGRKVATGECDMFLWVRQRDRTYKLLPETVNHWVVRRQGKRHQGGEIMFVSVSRWTAGGNGVVLATLYENGKHNLWHIQEIDLVRGRFAPDRAVAESKLGGFLI
ncbi:MAG: hypothetical protein QM758_17590 [Armatimonas sp.]